MRSWTKLSMISLAPLALASCKALDAADATIEMKGQMSGVLRATEDMKGETSKLTQAIHLQKLDAALKTIYAPENTKSVVPPSAGLLAGAKVFAEEATSLELVEFFYVTIKEIEKTAISERAKDDADKVAAFNHDKKVKLMALQAIAAQTPSSVVTKIMEDQILGAGGRYEDVAYQFLMCRALFLQDFYLDSGVLSGPLNNLGKLEKAYEYLNQLEFMAAQPFAPRIGLKLGGFVAPEENIDLKFSELVEPALKGMWRKVLRSIDRDLPDSFKTDGSPYARRVSEIREVAERNFNSR